MKKSVATLLCFVIMLTCGINYAFSAVYNKYQVSWVGFSCKWSNVYIEFKTKHGDIKPYYLDNNKLVIDISSCDNNIKNKNLSTKYKGINAVRTGQFNASTTRIVVDLSYSMPVTLTESKNIITVHLDTTKHGKNNIVNKLPKISTTSSVVNTVYSATYQNSNKVVVIDAGHGAKDSGAVGNNILEKNINLDIALRVQKILQQNGIKVYMTRSNDNWFTNNSNNNTSELTARAQYAEKVKANFFVSIHSNCADAASAKGIETLYYPLNGPMVKTMKTGKIDSPTLAQMIQNELINATGAVNRGIIPRPNLVVLKKTKVVPCLVEVGFVSNSAEAAKLKQNQYKQTLAQAISNGIIKAFKNN